MGEALIKRMDQLVKIYYDRLQYEVRHLKIKWPMLVSCKMRVTTPIIFTRRNTT